MGLEECPGIGERNVQGTSHDLSLPMQYGGLVYLFPNVTQRKKYLMIFICPRFWTYGYDIYTPHRAYIFHDYKTSQSDPTHSTWMASKGQIINGESGVSLQRASWARLTALLGMPGNTGSIDVNK